MALSPACLPPGLDLLSRGVGFGLGNFACTCHTLVPAMRWYEFATKKVELRQGTWVPFTSFYLIPSFFRASCTFFHGCMCLKLRLRNTGWFPAGRINRSMANLFFRILQIWSRSYMSKLSCFAAGPCQSLNVASYNNVKNSSNAWT